MHEQLSDQELIDRDLALFDMENTWRESLPRHTDFGWLQVFPEAVKTQKSRLINRAKINLMLLEVHLLDIKHDTKKALMENKYEWRDDLIKESARRQIALVEREIKSIGWQIKLMRPLKKTVDGVQSPKKLGITPAMVEAAKRFPLTQLVKVNRAGFAKCVWHTDAKPSMFCKKNFAFCFTCNRSGDTIAVLMETEGLSFKDAVMRLQ